MRHASALGYHPWDARPPVPRSPGESPARRPGVRHLFNAVLPKLLPQGRSVDSENLRGRRSVVAAFLEHSSQERRLSKREKTFIQRRIPLGTLAKWCRAQAIKSASIWF